MHKDEHTHAQTPERETCAVSKGFETEFFSLKYNLRTSECKIHSIEVDIHFFQIIKSKFMYFEYFLLFHQVGEK